MEASVISVSVPRAERLPPLIFRLIATGRRLRSAVRLKRIVRRHLRMSNEYKEFLRMVRKGSLASSRSAAIRLTS